jgi:hypothetical protein
LEIFRDAIFCLNYVFLTKVFEYKESERKEEKKGKEGHRREEDEEVHKSK